MSWPLVEIGKYVKKIDTWNPQSSDSDAPFSYIDLSSVDKELKEINDSLIAEVLPSEAPSRARQIVFKNDVLVATVRPNLNGVAQVPEKLSGATASTGYCVLRADEESLDSRYLFYWVQDTRFIAEMVEKATGANYPAVSDKIIKESKILLPPLAEQKRIAAILEKADAIRRKRQQAIQLADEFLRSVFLEMFGDPIINPKGWEVKLWSQALNIVNGRNQKAVEDENGEYPICGSGGFMAKANDWLTEKNSVIIGRKGNINTPILMKERFWNVDTAFGLEPNRVLLSHNYLFWFCKFYDFERHNKAVTIPSLTKADLLEIKMPLPSFELQKKFDAIVSGVEEKLEKNIIFSNAELFNSLSQQAFKGEL